MLLSCSSNAFKWRIYTDFLWVADVKNVKMLWSIWLWNSYVMNVSYTHHRRNWLWTLIPWCYFKFFVNGNKARGGARWCQHGYCVTPAAGHETPAHRDQWWIVLTVLLSCLLIHTRDQTIWQIIIFCHSNKILGLIYPIRDNAHGFFALKCWNPIGTIFILGGKMQVQQFSLNMDWVNNTLPHIFLIYRIIFNGPIYKTTS